MIFGRSGRSRTLGVDVGSTHVKVVEVDHSRGTPRLRRAGVRRLADGSGGPAGFAARAAAALRRLVGEGGVSRGRVVCGVGGRDVIVKAVRMGRETEGEGRDAIRREASRHVPFDLEAVELDFHVVDRGGGDSRMTVLVAAARREAVAERLGLLEAAGLEPRVVDAEPIAIHNCLEFNHPEAMVGVVGLAAIGHGHTALNVSHDGTPVLARGVAFGTGDLGRALVDDHGLSPRAAESVLRGREERLPGPLLRTIRRRAGKLAAAVERTSAFLEERAPGTRVGALYLCGGGARVPRLGEVLADRLGVEVHGANPLQALEPEPGALDAVDVDASLPLLVPAVGMALRRTG